MRRTRSAMNGPRCCISNESDGLALPSASDVQGTTAQPHTVARLRMVPQPNRGCQSAIAQLGVVHRSSALGYDGPRGDARSHGGMTATAGVRTLALLLALVLVAAAGAGVPTSAAEAATAQEPNACADGWSADRLPAIAAGARPHDLVAIDGKRAWLLGGSNNGPVAFRWRGGRWRQTRVAGKGSLGLMAGDGSRRQTIWAVGYDKSRAGHLGPLAGAGGPASIP